MFEPRNCLTDLDEMCHYASTPKLEFLLFTGFLLGLLLDPENGDYVIHPSVG
jgi:hypothetical protein